VIVVVDAPLAVERQAQKGNKAKRYAFECRETSTLEHY